MVLWQVWGIFANDWVERFLTGKEFYFKYWPFYFVQPWPGDIMNIHVALLAVSAAFVMVGLLYRFSAAATFFLLTYIFLLDRALYLNHLYLTCLIAFVMIFLPAHRSLSLDALLRPGLRSTAVPAWTLWLLRFQVAVPMFFGVSPKSTPTGCGDNPCPPSIKARPTFLLLASSSLCRLWYGS